MGVCVYLLYVCYVDLYVCMLALLADRRRPILTVDLAMLLPFVFIAYQQLTAACAAARLPLLAERNNVALLLVACGAARRCVSSLAAQPAT